MFMTGVLCKIWSTRTGLIVLFIITGSCCRHCQGVELFSFPSRRSSLRLWHSWVCRLDHRRRPGIFLEKHSWNYISPIWTEAQSLAYRTFKMLFEACDIWEDKMSFTWLFYSFVQTFPKALALLNKADWPIFRDLSKPPQSSQGPDFHSFFGLLRLLKRSFFYSNGRA